MQQKIQVTGRANMPMPMRIPHWSRNRELSTRFRAQYGVTTVSYEEIWLPSFEHHPELVTTVSYDVQSSIRLEIFELFLKGLETGGKIPVPKDKDCGKISKRSHYSPTRHMTCVTITFCDFLNLYLADCLFR
jgi:hypothetical protein